MSGDGYFHVYHVFPQKNSEVSSLNYLFFYVMAQLLLHNIALKSQKKNQLITNDAKCAFSSSEIGTLFPVRGSICTTVPRPVKHTSSF